MSPITNASQATAGALTGAGPCGAEPPAGGYQGRCGYDPRQPLLLVSPWAKVNFVDHRVTDQTSVLRFIEDNWAWDRIGDSSFDEKSGSLLNLFSFREGPRAKKLFLDPSTGEPMDSGDPD